MDSADCIVIGAGVIGLAIARALQAAGREVLILEAASAFGTGTSSRNSEVIHGGLYYPPGSLKARACLDGRDRLYTYCRERGVPFRAVGKLIVATTPAQVQELAAIEANAHAIGNNDLQRLSSSDAQAIEPELRCLGALLSPKTGIVDGHALMSALLADAEAHGAVLATQTPVSSAEIEDGGIRLETGGRDPMAILAKLVVNAAGHGAVPLARATAGLDQRHVPTAYLSKGNYFSLSGRSPFSHLIYPVPVPGGAGIHLTLDLAGQARFGPDVEPVETLDYAVDPARAPAFYADVRRYWPGLPEGALSPSYSGIRPKIVPATEGQDFVIQSWATHGIPGLINLFGIESPGLTASLALADYVTEITRSLG